MRDPRLLQEVGDLTTRQSTVKNLDFHYQDFYMHDHNQADKNNFLYQRHRYLGKFTPQDFVFNANLQEFSQRVNYICNLQSREKLSLQESYAEIEELWQQLKKSFKALVPQGGIKN